MAEMDTMIQEDSTSTNTDRDNLDRLLKIFNGGTGVNLGDLLVSVIEAQKIYDSTQETEYERELVDIIFASIKGWRIRKRPDMKLKLEEGKRKVTINDTRRPPPVAPHMTQRVKTFYMDPSEKYSLSSRDTVIIPNVATKSARARSMIGGTPITKETAIQLRKITLGTTVHSFSREWRKSALLFQDSSTKYPYGFQTSRCGSRALILCFQGYLMKHLLFCKQYSSSLATKHALQPTDFERRKALSGAVCDVLWQAGNQIRCCVCLHQDTAFFDTDYQYRVDGITEKLNLYEFKKFQDLEMFVKRHLSHFEHENSNGCILLLYSVILSRTVSRIYEDMGVSENDKFKLLADNEECSIPLVNLLLSGRAVPHYHNGNIIYDKDGNLLPQPLRGIKERSQVGFLFWDKGEEPDERTEIGSMLKTPKNPIWLTLVNGQYGLLFSNNADLVSDWRVEHHFQLYYYTGLLTKTYTVLTIDTRYTRRYRCKTGIARRVEEEKVPPLEQCILTKWYGANVDWDGVFPFY
ncbi:inactive ubiquitin carboxyl-terminal hydrolase MINDY-4B-like isoform X2 [Ruditapes philippinarum]|uniref:inactive ubiquitin carboxyl-terminal hydrolase MINDY-4B-like isoform X2 n=1 Tax=Ruditapes philippinarum TaxID=129788 RepID=UPI00295ACB8E|nr:inactive ubiquitin carboxyl-terminal hydrolase MINDY-4B-like isoform X2 [Ruditapes philippinarum]